MENKTDNHLQVFYGIECPHCEHMMRLLEKLKNEQNVDVELVEVWHNEENARIMEGCEGAETCGGVPFFYNQKTKEWLCGEVKYEELLEWTK